MLKEVIITCAISGAGDSGRTSRYVPVTPEQMAAEAAAAAAAGASVVHIHARDPTTGAPSMKLAHFQEIAARIRDRCPDIILSVATGQGARFVPGPDGARAAGQDSVVASPESRVEHVLGLRPDLCTIDVATMNAGASAVINVAPHVHRMVRMVQEAGVKPALCVFDLGHMRLASELVDGGVVKRPPLFQIGLGIPWGAPATAASMIGMCYELPAAAVWSAFGLSRSQFPMVAQAVLFGGHVRVGLEDNLYISHGELAQSNGLLVERAATIVRALGVEVASTARARVLLGLREPV